MNRQISLPVTIFTVNVCVFAIILFLGQSVTDGLSRLSRPYMSGNRVAQATASTVQLTDVITYYTYLPLVAKSPGAISGLILLSGMPVSGTLVKVEGFTPALPPPGTIYEVTSTVTNEFGQFAFSGVRSNWGGDEQFRVTAYGEITKSQLASWASPWFTYTAGTALPFEQPFDIAGVDLVAPNDNASITLPYTFKWIRRVGFPADSYGIYLFQTRECQYFYGPFGYVSSAVVSDTRPPIWCLPENPVWIIIIRDGSGGQGRSFARTVHVTW